jgi:hypothetical protein
VRLEPATRHAPRERLLELLELLELLVLLVLLALLGLVFPKIHEQFDLRIRLIKYEEDVCDTSGCAAVALRSFSGERRANF